MGIRKIGILLEQLVSPEMGRGLGGLGRVLDVIPQVLGEAAQTNGSEEVNCKPKYREIVELKRKREKGVEASSRCNS